MRTLLETVRELAQYAQRQSLFEWAVAYAAGAGLLWIVLMLLTQHVGWPDAVVRLSAIVLALGVVPALIIAWFRDVDYEPERTTRELLLFAAASVVVGAALWFLAPRLEPPPLEAVLAGTSGDRGAMQTTLAVRPFVLEGDVGDDAYLAAGLHADLIGRLRGIPALSVASQGAVASIDGSLAPGAAARALRVRYLLSGVLRRDGDRVRLQLRLTEGDAAAQLWARDYDRKVTDLLALQAELAELVARSVASQLGALELERLRRNPTDDPRAYNAFLEGQHQLRAATRDARVAAITAFRRAVLLDPQYARAWAGLADAYNFRADLFLPQEVWPVSSAMARRAMEIDPALPEVQAAQARILAYYDWNLGEADLVFRRALALGAKCGDESRVCESYFSVLNLMGRCDDAIALTRALVTQRVGDPSAYRRLGLAFLCARRYGEAIDALEQARELQVAPTPSAQADLLALLAMLHAYDRRTPTAIALAREALLKAPQEPIVLVNAGVALAVAKDEAGARAVLVLFAQLPDRGLLAPRTYRAQVHAWLGETAEAQRLLDDAFVNREAVLLEILNDAGFDPLRGTPQLRTLALRMGAERYLRTAAVARRAR